jgi:hypothetical protein
MGLSSTVERNLLGYLVQRACGVPQKLSNDAAAKYRKLAREGGVALALDGIENTGSMSVRLDLEQGRAVIEVG